MTSNYSQYGVLGGDCTNFVSQIVAAGGFPLTPLWWHSILNGQHKYSASWIYSDEFAKYFGVSFTTVFHSKFSQMLSRGDVILSDASSDGDWDHTGFVTDKLTTTGTLGYYDYKVAQHSSNYHLWASNQNNNWENQTGNRYGIISWGSL